MGFSTKRGIPWLINSKAMGTWVLFGVQIIAPSGFGDEEDSREVMEG